MTPTSSTLSAPSLFTFLLVGVCLGVAACRPIPEAPERWPVEHETRRVFAHYMVCCPTAGGDATVDDFAREIVAAQSRGIDGFALNLGGWSREPHYKDKLAAIYAAAATLDSGFLLFPSADFCCGLSDDDVIDLMESVYDHPNQFRFDGRPLLSSFSGGENLGAIAARLASAGRPVSLVPYVFPLPPVEHPRGRQIEDVAARIPTADGFFFFAGPGTPAQHVETNARLAHQWLGAGKVYMAGITPWYRGLGGNYRVYEGLGYEGTAAQWENAIRLRIPWVQIVTWNDWGEASYIAPFGPPESTDLWSGHWGPTPSHEGWLDASRHYIEWFKTGAPPVIRRDEIFYTYRTHSKHARGLVKPGGPDSDRPAGASSLVDSIFVTAHLTAPARLVVSCGERSTAFALAGGVHHVRAPLDEGTPRFRLERDGEVVIDKTGEHAISSRDAWTNFNPFAGSASTDP
ncbi:endo-1,3-alpha-glucanase family glycosylhydrolase [Congregicoccus parvus]|uniref:endo-1,3-alpha-glucanase family glycosylhydrolase n=1 Tax=Congregicoccus parvus TaxID=3081749 RepID=UPI003FA57BC3